MEAGSSDLENAGKSLAVDRSLSFSQVESGIEISPTSISTVTAPLIQTENIRRQGEFNNSLQGLDRSLSPMDSEIVKHTLGNTQKSVTDNTQNIPRQNKVIFSGNRPMTEIAHQHFYNQSVGTDVSYENREHISDSEYGKMDCEYGDLNGDYENMRQAESSKVRSTERCIPSTGMEKVDYSPRYVPQVKVMHNGSLWQGDRSLLNTGQSRGGLRDIVDMSSDQEPRNRADKGLVLRTDRIRINMLESDFKGLEIGTDGIREYMLNKDVPYDGQPAGRDCPGKYDGWECPKDDKNFISPGMDSGLRKIVSPGMDFGLRNSDSPGMDSGLRNQTYNQYEGNPRDFMSERHSRDRHISTPRGGNRERYAGLNTNQPRDFRLPGNPNERGDEVCQGYRSPYQSNLDTQGPMLTKGKHKIKAAPTFEGTENWRDYILQFEIIANMNGWNKADQAMELASSLRGKARGVLSDVAHNGHIDYDTLVKMLETHFDSANSTETYRTQLKNKVRRRNESLPELAHDIRDLVRKAYPQYNEQFRETLSLDCFVDSLMDGGMEWAIYQRKPRTLNEAVALAQDYEGFHAGQMKRQGSRIGTQRHIMDNHVLTVDSQESGPVFCLLT